MTDPATPTADFAAMGATVAQHDLIKPFAGVFKSEVRLWMGPGDPMVTTGVMTNTLDLGGRFLRHEYAGDPSPGPFAAFEGRGFWGYNTETKRFEGLWIDNMCTQFQLDYGDVDASGKVWTMRGEMVHPMDGTPLVKRTVITLVDDDHHTMETYHVGPDGTEHKAMEIRYERTR
jgi:hypothetical protein